MANLAASAVTINRAWTEGGISGKELSCRDVTLVLTGQGGTTNKILPSVLFLSDIQQATTAIKSDNSNLAIAVPAYDRSFLCLIDESVSNIPSDVTGTYRLVVKGAP